MLETVLNKQIDIYIAVATSLFGAVFGLLLEKMFSSNSQNKGERISITQTVSINTINHNSTQLRKNTQQGTELFMVFGGLFILTGLTLYGFFRTAILSTLQYAEILLLSLWIGAVLRSMISGRFKGFTWSIYLLYVAAFMIMYFIAISLAFNPIHAPKYFQYAEKIINHAGWFGLKRYFTADDLMWFAVHLFGIYLLIHTFWQMVMSLFHILMAGNNISFDKPDSWLIKKTAKYCSPWKNIIFFTLFTFLGGVMVSGLFLHWIRNEIPILLNDMMTIVLYGRGGA